MHGMHAPPRSWCATPGEHPCAAAVAPGDWSLPSPPLAGCDSPGLSLDSRRWLFLALTIFCLISFLAIPGALLAQEETPGPPSPRPEDVASEDAIVAAVYDVISGEAGEARDWDRWRSLFIPEARLISVSLNHQQETVYRVMTPEDYVELAGPALEASGFFEEEIGRTQEEFGPMVHRFSTYQSRRSLDDPEPFARGINSFQLLRHRNRWWVVTIYWTSERPDLPIPERYLSGRGGDR